MASQLENLLNLEQLDTNLFRSQAHCENFRRTLYGGQVLSQALMASYQTQEGLLPHSLHAYFLRAGSSETPVIYDVEKVRDGQSFSSRRVLARQFGRPIFNTSTSFHKQESGFTHQIEYPENIPSAEEIIKLRGNTENFLQSDKAVMPFHVIPLNEDLFSEKIIDPPEGFFWIKTIDTLPDDPIIHHCALAFSSDLGLLATALLPHDISVFDSKMIVASIDHAMWFHRSDFRADQWLLCKTFSPWAGNARGFTQGYIFNTDKQLVASITQEGLIRPI